MAIEVFITSNWPVETARSYKKTAATISQMIRNSAKTSPTPALARTIDGGIPKTPTAMADEVKRPINAANHAEALPEASKPRSTNTGTAAAKVEPGQKPSGSYCWVHTLTFLESRKP